MTSSFVIDEWRVEPSRGRLVHETTGEEIQLRPKPMSLLVTLSGAQGEVLGRETLLSEVWPETLARDESLNRCVADLRAALGDNGRHPRYIETVPKRGYRLIPPAQPCTGQNGKVAPEPATSGQRPTRTAIALLAIVSLLVLAGILSAWLRQPERGDPMVVAVVPPRAPADAPWGAQLVAAAAADLLQLRLRDVPSLILRSPGSLNPAMSAESATAMGADLVLELELVSAMLDHKVQIAVTLHDARNEAVKPLVLGRFDFPTLDGEERLSEFLAARELVIERVVARALIASDIPQEAVTEPRDVASYRLYLQARDLLVRPGCDGPGPNLLLQRALERDPEFVPAWVALAWADYGLAATCGLGPEHYDQALASADRALALRPDWVPATAVKATVLVETGKAPDALDGIALALKDRPDSAALHFARSYASCYVGDLVQAEEALFRTLELDPLFLTAEGWTPNVLLYQQQYRAFLDLLPATRSTVFDWYRGYALLRTNRVEDARAALESAMAHNPTDIFGRLSSALLAVIDNDKDASANLLRALAHERARHGVVDGEITFKIAQIAALSGDIGFAEEQLELAFRQGFDCRPCVTDDDLFAFLAPVSPDIPASR